MLAKQVPITVINGLLAFLLLYYISVQVPVAGLLISALLPLPIIITIQRAGWLPGLLMVAAGVGSLYYLQHFSGIKTELLPILHMVCIGLAMSFFTLRNHPLEIIIGGTVAVTVLLQTGIFLFQAWQHGLTAGDYLQQTVEEVWTTLAQLAEKDKFLEPEALFGGLSQAEVTKLMAQMAPAFLVINNTLVVLLNYFLSRAMRRGAADEPPALPLVCWEAPGWLVFVLIGSGFLLLVPSQAVQMVGVNLLLVCALVYFFQGLAIIGFSFNRFGVPRFIRWIAYGTLVFIKPAMLLVIFMGLIDLWLDFRHLHRPPAEE